VEREGDLQSPLAGHVPQRKPKKEKKGSSRRISKETFNRRKKQTKTGGGRKRRDIVKEGGENRMHPVSNKKTKCSGETREVVYEEISW